MKPSATGRLLKAGVAVLVAGALLLLLGAVGAFYFWNNNEKHVRVTFDFSLLFPLCESRLHCKKKKKKSFNKGLCGRIPCREERMGERGEFSVSFQK